MGSVISMFRGCMGYEDQYQYRYFESQPLVNYNSVDNTRMDDMERLNGRFRTDASARFILMENKMRDQSRTLSRQNDELREVQDVLNAMSYVFNHKDQKDSESLRSDPFNLDLAS